MVRRSVSLLLSVLLMSTVVVVVGASSASATLEVVDVELVSVAFDGSQANGYSEFPALSADGAVVTYFSTASNLVPSDTNGTLDVFVYERATESTSRVSVASDGTQGNDESHHSAISGDGTVVAFLSHANNLVPGDTNVHDDAFFHDRTAGTTTRVSVASDGTQANGQTYWKVAISDDGSIVAYSSFASNLVPGDTNGASDVFVHEPATGATTRVSVASDGSEGNGDSGLVGMSADGSIVVFGSWANNLVPGDTCCSGDVFVHDRTTGVTSRLLVGNDSLSMSGDLSVFASESQASPSATLHIDVHDRTTGATDRISVAPDGTPGNGWSFWPVVSGDGSVVSYLSEADNLVPAVDTNKSRDVFVYDREAGTTTLVSVALDGTAAGGSYQALSDDGTVVAFSSTSDNLVPGDTNGHEDIFVASLAQAPEFDVGASASCDDVVVSWSASNVDGWRIEVGYPPGYWYATELTEPSGEVRFGEPWLFGTYEVALYDEHDDLVPGSEELFELGQPAGCGYANVMIAGGTAVVSDQVEDELGGLSRSVSRVAGANRYATAAEVSRAHFPQLEDEGQPVLVATGENWPDALAGGPAAARFGGPILLVQRNSIPAVTAAELRRIDPARIHILGGTAVISTTVENQLAGYTDGAVVRLAGRNRYATAAAISRRAFPAGVDAVYVATGVNFPDALAGGPAAAARGGPILLVQKDAIPGDTAAELRRLDPGRVYILGGTAVVSSGVANQLRSYTDGAVIRLAGANRYGTAAAICADTFSGDPVPSMAYIATGQNFPDGLTAGPVAGIGGSPILLVTRDTIPGPTRTELRDLNN